MAENALILAPRGRDAAQAQAILAEAGLPGEIIASLADLVERVKRDCGYVLLAEEVLEGVDALPLKAWCQSQPQWSDLSFILLTGRGEAKRNPAASRYLDLLGNVVFLERPFHPTSLVALARAALRGRRKQYEARTRLEALHQSQERFRAAVEAVEGVLWTNSAEGRMEGEQPGWAAMTGQHYEAYQGYGWADAVHPDDAQRSIDAWNHAVKHTTAFALDHRVRQHDGAWRTFSVRAIPTFSTDGTLREWVGVHTDITDRLAAEAALRDLNRTLEDRVAAAIAQRKVFADIFETTDSFVQVVDADFRWLAINRAAADELHRAFGRYPAVGDSVLDWLADQPRQQAAVRDMWQRALDGSQFDITGHFGDPPDSRRFYDMKFNTLHDSDGKRIGAFMIATDVTQRVDDAARLAETQDALRQSQKMEAIGQLTGGVAHDFNNLLTIIRGGTEVLRADSVTPERRKRYLDAIFDAADRAAKLTQQLLAFSRRQPLRAQVIDVGDRIAATVDMLRPIMRQGIAIDLDCAPGLRVNVDPTQFETALVNLAINARDAMHHAGKLTIRASSKGDQVVVRVEDDGEGIDPANLPRLFEPFFTTKAVGKGTGLGLSQVYGFARQSGGDVRVESRQGIGTSFTLLLPATTAELADDIPKADLADRPSRRVLVVEDNDALRSFAAALLTDMGHDVGVASSAGEALAAIHASPDRYDVVFTDVVMAGMSGLDLARHIRETWPELRIVLASGFSDALANAEGLEFPLLSKPYTGDQLAAIL